MSEGSGRVLVTGAAGFIASHVIERLLDRGMEVTGIDNFCDFYDPAVKRRNAASLAARGGFSMVEGDIRDSNVLRPLFEEFKPRVVIHLAAMAGVRPSLERPVLYADVNINGTTNMLRASVMHGVERFLFASSSSVYGNAAKVPFAEDDPVGAPVSPYADTKYKGELLVDSARQQTGMKATSLRLFTVFGPRQRPDLAISRFLDRVSRGEPIQVFGDGTSSRDYTYVGDIANGIVAAIDAGLDAGVINLGNSHPVSLAELVRTVEEVCGRTAVIERLPMQLGDVERTWADISRARALLGFEPAVGIREGIERQWEWMRAGRG